MFTQEATDPLDSFFIRIQLDKPYPASEIGHFRAFASFRRGEVAEGLFAFLFGSSDRPSRMRAQMKEHFQDDPAGIGVGMSYGQWIQRLEENQPDKENPEESDGKWQPWSGGSSIGVDPVTIISIAEQRLKLATLTRDWHFVDLEISGADMNAACFGRPSLAAGTPASAGPAKDCVVDKIEEFEAELSSNSNSAAERLMALQFLLHFVGDMHQPLHSSDDEDQGGNGETVNDASGNSGKLHGFWDTQFVEALGTDPRKVAEGLIAKISTDDETVWKQGTPEQWAMEAYQAAKDVSYGDLPQAGPDGTYELDGDYETKAEGVISNQLSKAGVRLAAVLNRSLER